MDVLVDSNVILDVATRNRRWFRWSSEALGSQADRHTLVINPIIYAEVSMGFRRIEDLEEALPAIVLRREEIPWEAAFLAGRRFLDYGRRAKKRRLALRDFLVGAHAAVGGMLLLTRDAGRYGSYFPALRGRLVAPRGERGSNRTT